MPFSALIGNERIKQLLRRAVAEGRIGQSLLMSGPRGVGKYQFALALAQALNCERVSEGDACGACVPCRKIALGEHADVRTIINEGQFIRIEQMREMSRDAQFKPYEGRRRVYIVDEAERMNAPSANSILKTLEEPPESTLIVLVTSKPYRLPETIRSRCLMLSFAPLTAAKIEEHLNKKDGKTTGDVKLRARLARGSIGHALEIDLEEYRKMRSTVFELVEALASTCDLSKLLGISEYLGRKLEREQFERHLDALMVLLDDLFHLKLNASEESLTNADIAERLRHVAEKITLDQITEWVDRIEEIFRALPRNVNRQLAMEAMLITAH
jgi:DNA polymerase-3 subunit delta'